MDLNFLVMSLRKELLQRISTASLTIKFLRSYEFCFLIVAQLLHYGTRYASLVLRLY